MGLFSRKKEMENTRSETSLSVLNGVPVQVRTPQGAYLFNAVVQPMAQNTAYLRWYGGIDPETLRAQMPGAFQVVLRYFQKEAGPVFYVSGVIRPSGPQTWAMSQIVLSEEESDREDFRQPITFWGRAFFSGQNSKDLPFQTTDISAQGIGLLMARPCMKDEEFRAEAPFLKKMGIPPLLCRVCYTVLASPGSYHYGCKFVDMDPMTERALSTLIIQIQTRRDTFVE